MRLAAIALTALLGACASTTNDDETVFITVLGGMDLEPGIEQGEFVADRLIVLEGQTRDIHFTIPAHDLDEGYGWALEADGEMLRCEADGPVPFAGDTLTVNMQPYNHLLVTIENADEAMVTCAGLIMEVDGRFAVSVEPIPTANAVTLTAR